MSGVGIASQEDCRAASERICDEVLNEMDFQLGKNKVFLKVGALGGVIGC